MSFIFYMIVHAKGYQIRLEWFQERMCKYELVKSETGALIALVRSQ